jgi:nitrate reductase alpha subunit
VTGTRTPPTEPGAALLRTGRFFRPGTAAPDLHSIGPAGGREAHAFYRDRWSRDKVVNSTHGVNCTDHDAKEA